METERSTVKTALHIILENCHLFPTKPALHWLDSDCKVTEQYTYEQVEHRTRELANGLLGLIQRNDTAAADDVVVKERAVLCYPPGLEFILTFLACLRAGIIAVPVSPPNPHQPDYSAEMLVRIIHDCGAAFVLTSKEFANHKSIVKLIRASPVPWHCEVATEMVPEESNDHEINNTLDQAQLEDIPFLQYTSGSTGTPKGVMPTHNTLLNNFKLMQEIMKTDSSMVEISFLPHFHAMGLICSYLQVLYHGGTGYFMSPVTFVENPGLWMKAFSLFHGTHAKAPNFAFELVMKKGFPKNADLGTARYIVTGSEPVSIETIEEFESTLAPHGLKKNTVRAGYGLAEHSVYLCGVRNHDDPTIIDGRISCGVPLPGVVVEIVDPETHSVMSEGEEGEIWVDSPCKALGYWEKEEKSLKVFEAQLDESSNRTYLRTGDLGFVKNGELFVSGRVKNVIIVHGRKLHPSDIEMRVESSFTELQPGRSVACHYQVERSTNQMGIAYVAELRSPKNHSLLKLDALSKQISTIIGLNFQIECHQVVLIHPRTMPCTTSGKRQRLLCKKKLIDNTLEEVFRWSRGSDMDVDAHRQTSRTSCPRTGSSRAVVMDSNLESGPEKMMEPIFDPHIDINILEPSDSESNLDTWSEPNSTKNTLSILEPIGECHMATLQVDYPNMVRTERRKSAPPLPVDRESKMRKSKCQSQRRKSAMDKSASLSRLYKRRNSLQTLTDTVGGILGMQIQPDSNIWMHGCNSIKAIQLSQQLQSEFGFAVEPHHFFIHQTPKALLGKLQRSLLSMSSPPSAESEESDEPLAAVEESSSVGSVLDTLHEVVDEGEDRGMETKTAAVRRGLDVAIVGMACTYAGCSNTDELWETLINKKVATTSLFIPSSREMISGGFTQATGMFDYKWFGVSEWEASTMDPQQSMLLHTAWDCLEDAGSLDSLTPSHEGTLQDLDCGVFVGISMDNDAHYLSHAHGVTPVPTSITSSVAANRIARAFNMKGPVMSVDTACASSLSALDMACKSLRDEDCRAALVCGVNAILDPYRYALLNKMGMLSPDELCKVFDASADGYVRGEGCGAVLLMPLALAEQEGRRILAVVKSTASNNNGASSATLTSPSGKDQEALVSRALRKARLSARDISYIEAHGTGTKLGDPIEVDAIETLFGSNDESTIKSDKQENRMERNVNSSVVVGSVKANVGHLETGAGMAGLVKSVMVLEHSLAPGNACLGKLNPCFRLSDNIRITSDNVVLRPATSSATPAHTPSLLAAMVNSFGFGGTNTTTVLQQYTPLPHMARSECTLLFNTSADSHMDRRLNMSTATTVRYLSSRFPTFQRAASACDDVVKKVTATLGKDSLDLDMVAVVKMYYSLVSLARSLGVKFATVGGMDVVGEVLSLVVANSLDLDHAMFLILTSWSSSCTCLQDLQKIIRPPAIPVLSCILGKISRPSDSPIEIGSSEYCMQLIAKLKAITNRSMCLGPSTLDSCNTKERLLDIVEREITHPLFSLIIDSSAMEKDGCKNLSVVVNLSEFHCTEDNVNQAEQYIREKFIELRKESDRLQMAKNSSRPMKDTEHLMPDFHKRYPLRAYVDSRLQQQTQVSLQSPEGARGDGNDKTNCSRTPQTPRTPQSPHTPSPSAYKGGDTGSRNDQVNQRKLSTLSTSSSVESGYLTQENSRESLPTSVPPNTPISAPSNNRESKTANLEYKLDRERLVLALKENQPTTIEEQQKWEIVSNILEELKEDLDSPDVSLEEVAESGMYDLGLDSLNVMQTAEFLKKKYDVKMTFVEVLDHGTIGRLAEFIVKKSPVFKTKGATGSEQPSSSPSLRISHTQLSPGSSGVYPTLTKADYYTEPPMEHIQKMQPSMKSGPQNGESSQHLFVKDFAIGRRGVGKVVFIGETDVAHLDLDKLVRIKEKEVEISSREPGSERLNKPATVYFENVFPQCMMTEQQGAMVQSLKEHCMKALPSRQFVDYRATTGQFITKMERFY